MLCDLRVCADVAQADAIARHSGETRVVAPIASEVRKRLFLPVFFEGKRIIAETSVDGQYLVDNSQLAVVNSGMSYRSSRHLEDRAGYGPDWFA